MNELEVRCNLLLEVEECRLLELVVDRWVCLCKLNIVCTAIFQVLALVPLPELASEDKN